jgi:hypothetical protein
MNPYLLKRADPADPAVDSVGLAERHFGPLLIQGEEGVPRPICCSLMAQKPGSDRGLRISVQLQRLGAPGDLTTLEESWAD